MIQRMPVYLRLLWPALFWLGVCVAYWACWMLRLLVLVVAFIVANDCSATAQQSRPVRAEITISPEAAKRQIGCLEFFDKNFSITGKMSCATCHNPDRKLGWGDGLDCLVGARGATVLGNYYELGIPGIRNTMSVINCFTRKDKPCWRDGRTEGLYYQCWAATADQQVLGMPTYQSVVDRMNQQPRYRELTKIAFGVDLISEQQARVCMVEFLCTIRWENLPCDRLAAGLKTEMPPSVVRGFKVFDKHCTVCHQPDNDWQDDLYHNIGIASKGDIGRQGVTGLAADRNAFRTSDIRGVCRTAPFMHDGSFKSIERVVRYKGGGGRYFVGTQGYRDPNIDPLIAKISLTEQEILDCTAFLELATQDENYPFVEDPWKKGGYAIGN